MTRRTMALAGSIALFVAVSGCGSPDPDALVPAPGEGGLDPFSARKQYLEVGPWRVAYIDEGKGAPVVLLHGCPFHAYQWRDLIPRLASSGRRVLAPDLLGLGDTQVRLGDDYRLPNQVRMVVGFMDAFGIAGADFVAADHGAATLQLMMRDHPERIRRAIITNAEAYDLWPSEPELPYLKLVVSPWLGPLFRFALRFEVVARVPFAGAVDLESPEIRAALERDGISRQDAERMLESVVSLKLLARR